MTAAREPDPIDAYLDRLLIELHGRASDVRRVLVEAEEHLRDAAEEGVRQGLEPDEAERRAVERFGPAPVVARRFAADLPLRLSRATVAQVVLALLLLGGIGCVAVGASGAVAAGMGSLWGKTFVSGDSPEISYTPARCADFQEYEPRPTCAEAAAAHHFDEVVTYRLAAGVLGLLALAAWWVARRRVPSVLGVLPDGFVPTVGAAVFGVAAAGLLFAGLTQIPAGSTNGAGQYLSGGVVALVVGALFLRSLLRVLAVRAAVAA